jgi:hypothetical protein
MGKSKSEQAPKVTFLELRLAADTEFRGGARTLAGFPVSVTIPEGHVGIVQVSSEGAGCQGLVGGRLLRPGAYPVVTVSLFCLSSGRTLYEGQHICDLCIVKTG